jgi:hypothetical protein
LTFNPSIWFPIAVVLTVINVAGAGYAAGQAEPWHATVHVVLALASGLWAQRLRQRRGQSESQDRLEAPEALGALETEVRRLQQELSETQERLDFAERLLVQGQQARREDPQR